MTNKAAVQVSIIDVSGDRIEREYSASELLAGESVLSVEASQIVLVEIMDNSLSASQVEKLFAVQPGEFDVDESINQDVRAEVDPDEEFGAWEDWYSDGLFELPFSPRFIRIAKGDDISWLWLIDSGTGKWLPVLVNDMGFTDAKEIATYRWFTESGAPVTWAGGAALYQLKHNLFIENVYGDSPADPTITNTDGSEAQLLGVLEEFCLDEMRQADVAIFFEKSALDNLDSKNKSEITALLNDYSEYAGFSVSVSEEIKVQLKARLVEKSEIYRRLKGFFLNPYDEGNEAILDAFQEVVDSGITGAINGSHPDWV